jgi:hypothetical protein
MIRIQFSCWDLNPLLLFMGLCINYIEFGIVVILNLFNKVDEPEKSTGPSGVIPTAVLK